MTNTIMNVPGMSCGHCARTITTTLTPMAGTREVRVDLRARQVHVEYDETQIGIECIEAALQAAGYPVASVEVNPAEPVLEPGSLTPACACCSL